jgi:RNA polymerase sigma-70 factor (ECF subfamily)
MSYSYKHFSQLKDSELIEQYKNTADKQLIGELFKRYTHLVLGVCLQYLKDKELAKDATIQIFEKLFVELKKRQIENFKGWLTFVVRNYCISELRKKQTQLIRDKEYQYETTYQNIDEDNESLIKQQQQLDELEKAIKNLNPFQKKCIELFYLKNMSYSQIVEITGYSVGDVKSYIQNGKRNIKIMLTETK